MTSTRIRGLFRQAAVAAAFGLLVGVSAAGVSAQDAEVPRFEPRDCAFQAGSDVECGTLFVRENRATGEGVIELAVAIYPATDSASEPPLIFLQGGPGGAIVENSPLYAGSFTDPLRSTRDVIFIDQRGTGLSTPALNCPEFRDLILDDLVQNYDTTALAGLAAAAFASCRATLEAQGVDLSAYTSAENAADIADLATALGVEQVDLYGASYGTRLALTIMRDFPERVRAVVLDAVLGPAEEQAADIAFVAENHVSQIFADCAADAACSAAFPTLEADYYAVVDRLNAEPVSLNVIVDPSTGEELAATVDGADFQTAILYAGYNTPYIPIIPLVIHAAAEVDYSGVADFLGLIPQTFDGVSIGMNNSVICAEEINGRLAADFEAAFAEHPRFAQMAAINSYGGGQGLVAACDVWGVPQADAVEDEPVDSAIPTLLLVGTNDPVTPPPYARQVAETLPNSTVLEFPGIGHVVALSSSCGLEAVSSFLSNPSAPVEPACLEGLKPTFVTPDTDFTLAPVQSTTYGYQTVAPEGWQELSPGVFAASMTDASALVGLVTPGDSASLLATLAMSGQMRVGDPVDTITTDFGEWTVYEGAIFGQRAVAAIGDQDGQAAVLVVIGPPGTRELYRQALLIPAIENFSLNR